MNELREQFTCLLVLLCLSCHSYLRINSKYYSTLHIALPLIISLTFCLISFDKIMQVATHSRYSKHAFI